MSTRSSSRGDFEEFVAVCSGRLLRAAYALTGDRERAEDLLEAALADAWLRWRRLDAPPEPYVRAVLVDRCSTWWRPSRRVRALAVLRQLDASSEPGSSEGPAVEAERVEDIGVQQRLAALDRRIALADRRRRTSTVVGLGAGAALAVGAVVVVPHLVPDGIAPGPVPPSPSSSPSRGAVEPPVLVDQQLPAVLTVNHVGYQYFRSAESTPGEQQLRVDVAMSARPQQVAWVSPPQLKGRLVVTVDGHVVNHDPAGSFRSGLLISARRPHVVVVRATQEDISLRLGIAVYRWPRP